MSNKNYESHRKAIVSKGIPPALLNRLTNSDVQVINTFLSKQLARTVLIFTESSDQLSRATDRVPGLPASPGYAQ